MVRRKVSYMLPVLLGSLSCFGMQLSEKAQLRLAAVRNSGNPNAKKLGTEFLDGDLPEGTFLSRTQALLAEEAAKQAAQKDEEAKAQADREKKEAKAALISGLDRAYKTGDVSKFNELYAQYEEALPGLFSQWVLWRSAEELPNPWPSALQCPAKKRDDLYKALIEKGFDPNAVVTVQGSDASYQANALTHALDPEQGAEYRIGVVKALLRAGANPEITLTYRSGVYPKGEKAQQVDMLRLALYLARPNAIEAFLKDHKCLATPAALQLAAAKGDMESLRRINQSMCDTGATDKEFFEKACLEFRNPLVVDWALENGFFDKSKAKKVVESVLAKDRELKGVDSQIVEALMQQDGWTEKDLEELSGLADKKDVLTRKVDASEEYRGLVSELQMVPIRNSEAYEVSPKIKKAIETALSRVLPVYGPELPPTDTTNGAE